MKRKLLALSVLIVFVFSYGFSQDTPVSKSFRLGLKVAPSIAWLKPVTGKIDKAGSKIGLSYGLMGDFYFTDNYGISTGIDVSYNGGNLDSIGNGFIKKEKYMLQYIEIPLTLKMRTKEYGYITYFAQFGFGGAFNIKAKQDYKYSGTVPANFSDKTNVDVTNEAVNMFRASFIVGLGIEYSLTGSTRAIVGLGFNNGLTDMLKGKHVKAVNNYISLNAGILF